MCRQHEFSFEENAVRSGTKVYRMKVRNDLVLVHSCSLVQFSGRHLVFFLTHTSSVRALGCCYLDLEKVIYER